jgi:hypothetical protein
MLESGEANSMKEIARREGVDDSYVSRMVNLTTLAPDIVAAILDETLPPEVTLFELAAAATPLVSEEQWGRIGRSDDASGFIYGDRERLRHSGECARSAMKRTPRAEGVFGINIENGLVCGRARCLQQ